MAKILILLVSVTLVSPTMASDSLKTVKEFGYDVFNNLLIKDTLLGNARLDSGQARRCVRNAVVDVGTLIPPERAKTIVTTDGTFGYLVDTHMDSVRTVFLKKGRFGVPIDVVPMDRFVESFNQMGTVPDTINYEFCAIHGDSVYLYPFPARVDTIYLFYTGRGATPTIDTNTVDLPHELYSAVEYLATVKAAAILSWETKRQVYAELYDREIAKLIRGKKPQ